MTKRELTDTGCRNAKPKDRVHYLPDRGPDSVRGLRLCVRPNGSKLWMLRFTKTNPDGSRTESTSGLGTYPEVTLSEARRKARESRNTIAEGIHPKTARRLLKTRNAQASAATFGALAQEWLDHNQSDWSAHHSERNAGLLRRILLPQLGNVPVTEISQPMLLAVVRKAYDGGTRESARRARAVAAQIFRFAIDTHRATSNPARDLAESSLLKKPEVRHFAAIKADQLGPMLRALAQSGMEPVTRAALLLMMFTGLRDAALRGAQWPEIDLDAAVWVVPAERMKSGREHKVPLPTQAVAILKYLKQLTGATPRGYVFASSGKAGFLAENTLRIALHRLGFKVTAHGFRSLLTDELNKAGFNPDAIERQLDHVQKDKVRASYLRTDFYEQRVAMMQWFADWAEAQRNATEPPALPTNVVALRRVA